MLHISQAGNALIELALPDQAACCSTAQTALSGNRQAKKVTQNVVTKPGPSRGVMTATSKGLRSLGGSSLNVVTLYANVRHTNVRPGERNYDGVADSAQCRSKSFWIPPHAIEWALQDTPRSTICNASDKS